jgi:Cu/Ag efflux pump CusA
MGTPGMRDALEEHLWPVDDHRGLRGRHRELLVAPALQERMNEVQLPYGAQPGLDPLTSPIGEIYRYTLESPTRDLRELSDIQFWKVIPRLKQIPGVADVTNWWPDRPVHAGLRGPTKLMQFGVSCSGRTPSPATAPMRAAVSSCVANKPA